MRKALGTVWLAASLATAAYSAGINPAFTPAPGISPWFDSPVNLGLVFTPNTTLSVNALGFYAGPNISAGETVGLYDAVGNLVTQTVVPDTGPVTDGYYWQAITPVLLTGGAKYTVSAFTGANGWSLNDSTPGIYVNPEITPVLNGYGTMTVYQYNSSAVFPNTPWVHTSYYGPNFSTPDAGATAGLLGLGLAGLGWLRRRLH